MFQSHFSYSALRAQWLRTPLIAPLLATWLRGTGPLRSLRKACALLFASPSTAESGLKLSMADFSIKTLPQLGMN
jgi:hypothetical protein